MSDDFTEEQVRGRAVQLIEEATYDAYVADETGPNVILIYDPMIKKTRAVGPYPNAPAARAAKDVIEADVNHPRNNDGVDCVFTVVPLEQGD